jgi:uncharacterized protein YlxW (UPF0749 family)
MNNRLGRSPIAILIIGIVMGFVVAVVWNGASTPSSGSSTSSRERTASTIARLEKEQEELKATIGQLRNQIDEYQRRAPANAQTLAEITAEINRQQMLAGLTALEGPGIRVTLDDSSAPSPVLGAGANAYIVHEYDLRDIVNLLWLAGSEAIAINDERVVVTTSIYCVGSTVMVNDTRLSPPYRIQALGDPTRQEEALSNTAYLKDLRERVKRYGLQFKFSRMGQLVIPAYSGRLSLRYASTGY